MASQRVEALVQDTTEDVVARLMATGHFASSNDVIRQAVLLLEQREIQLNALDRLIGEADEEVDKGDLLDADFVFAEIRSQILQK